MSTDRTPSEGESPRRHSAGIFDVRNIIGALLAIYGIVLLLVHFFGGDDSATGGPTHDQANLWTGAALLLAGLIFFAWTTLRPIVVDEAEEERLTEEKREQGTPGSTSGSTSD